MLLAELEVFQSRPIAPTRRVALGTTLLPTSPMPGFGGLLLGGIVARFAPQLDPDLLPDLLRLTHQVEAGHRIPQPRLRHRLQDDRIGLNAHRHRLLGSGDALQFDLDASASAAPSVLGAVYAAGRLDALHRPATFAAMRRGLRWQGPVGRALVDHLTGFRSTASWSGLDGHDPVLWAVRLLGLTPEGYTRKDVQTRFRALLRQAHPDHGGASTDAAARIAALTEARGILLAGTVAAGPSPPA